MPSAEVSADLPRAQAVGRVFALCDVRLRGMGTGRLPERLPSGSNPTWPYRILHHRRLCEEFCHDACASSFRSANALRKSGSAHTLHRAEITRVRLPYPVVIAPETGAIISGRRKTRGKL
jgi:hypothetical protein